MVHSILFNNKKISNKASKCKKKKLKKKTVLEMSVKLCFNFFLLLIVHRSVQSRIKIIELFIIIHAINTHVKLTFDM